MSEKQSGLFHASFVYTDAILSDFEAMYLDKKTLSVPARLILGVLGAAGAVYFAWMLYREGPHFTRIGYLLICSVMLVLSLSRGKGRPDDTLAKYRKYYLGRRATFQIDEEGVEMKLEGQKNYARSRFKDIYGLYDTDLCLYFVIKGKAYYILPKSSVGGGSAEELAKYMEKKCGKKFLRYTVTKGEENRNDKH